MNIIYINKIELDPLDSTNCGLCNTNCDYGKCYRPNNPDACLSCISENYFLTNIYIVSNVKYGTCVHSKIDSPSCFS